MLIIYNMLSTCFICVDLYWGAWIETSIRLNNLFHLLLTCGRFQADYITLITEQ